MIKNWVANIESSRSTGVIEVQRAEDTESGKNCTKATLWDPVIMQKFKRINKTCDRTLSRLLLKLLLGIFGARMAFLSSQPKKRTRLFRLGSVYVGALVFAWSPKSPESSMKKSNSASEVLECARRVLSSKP
ncbi:hypothetical protein TNCV_2779531 [Trichonephila clavipes]|nr:hypothetical protein TNCV_2779531 [Trichonephila clavipes]